jgi:hypothetical protein
MNSLFLQLFPYFQSLLHTLVPIKRVPSLAWWCAPVIPALRRQRLEDCEFKASLGYLARSCLKKKKKERKKKKKGKKKSTQICQVPWEFSLCPSICTFHLTYYSWYNCVGSHG